MQGGKTLQRATAQALKEQKDATRNQTSPQGQMEISPGGLEPQGPVAPSLTNTVNSNMGL